MGGFNIQDNPGGNVGAIPWLVKGLKTLWGRVNGISGTGGGGAPSGPAGGDLTGTYPDPTISTNASPTIKALTIDNRPGPSALALGSGSSRISDAAGALTIQANSLGLPADTEGQTQSPGDNSTKMATTAYVDRIAGAITVGATVTGGTNNELLFQDGSGKVAQSADLVYDSSSFQIGINTKFTKNTLNSSTLPAITVQNTAAATNVQNQVSPSFEFLGRTWGAASNTTGFRGFASGVSAGRGAFYPVFNIQSTVDGSTYIDVLKLYSASSGQSATLGTPLTVTGALSATSLIGTSLNLGAGGANLGVIYNLATQTSVGGSTSGTANFSQPEQGGSYKKVIVYCSDLVGTASYTFPTVFTQIPAIVTTNGPAAGIVTSLSTSAMTLTGASTTGFIILEGY